MSLYRYFVLFLLKTLDLGLVSITVKGSEDESAFVTDVVDGLLASTHTVICVK